MTTINFNSSPLILIPDEMLLHISSFSEGKSILALSMTCKKFFETFSEDTCKQELKRETPILKWIPETFMSPFSEQIPRFWKFVWINKKDGAIAHNPASKNKADVPELINLSPSVTVNGKTYNVESLKKLGWGNSVHYFIKILNNLEQIALAAKQIQSFSDHYQKYSELSAKQALGDARDEDIDLEINALAEAAKSMPKQFKPITDKIFAVKTNTEQNAISQSIDAPEKCKIAMELVHKQINLHLNTMLVAMIQLFPDKDGEAVYPVILEQWQKEFLEKLGIELPPIDPDAKSPPKPRIQSVTSEFQLQRSKKKKNLTHFQELPNGSP